MECINRQGHTTERASARSMTAAKGLDSSSVHVGGGATGEEDFGCFGGASAPEMMGGAVDHNGYGGVSESSVLGIDRAEQLDRFAIDSRGAFRDRGLAGAPRLDPRRQAQLASHPSRRTCFGRRCGAGEPALPAPHLTAQMLVSVGEHVREQSPTVDRVLPRLGDERLDAFLQLSGVQARKQCREPRFVGLADPAHGISPKNRTSLRCPDAEESVLSANEELSLTEGG
jgi:hypothetical protein